LRRCRAREPERIAQSRCGTLFDGGRKRPAIRCAPSISKSMLALVPEVEWLSEETLNASDRIAVPHAASYFFRYFSSQATVRSSASI
jgi:hypothetical protein